MGIDWGGVIDRVEEGVGNAFDNPSQTFSGSNIVDTFASIPDRFSSGWQQVQQGNSGGDAGADIAAQAAQLAQQTQQQLQQAQTGLPYATAYAQSMFGPQQQALGFSQDSINQQIGMALANKQFQTGQLNEDHQLNMQMLGLDQRGIDSSKMNLSELRALAKEQYGLDKSEIGRDFKRTSEQLLSDATTRGAYTSSGYQRDQKYAYGDALVAHQNADIGYKTKQADFDQAERNLDIQAERLGISKKQLSNQLESALQQLGLSTWMDVNGLMQSLYGNNADQAAMAQQILQWAIQNAGSFGTPQASGQRRDQASSWIGRGN